MPSAIQCVVFDLDDTLYLERDYVRSGFQAVGDFVEGRFGLSGFSAIAWEEFESGRRGDIFDRGLERLGGPPESPSIERLVEVYRNHFPSISLQPDARECLEGLRGQVALGLITDGPLASQKAKAKALGVDRWIENRIFTDELGPECGKPSPQAFQKVELLTGIQGGTCVYIADNPLKDFAGPKVLGWRTIRIKRPGGLYLEQQSGQDVDAEVNSLSVEMILG